MGLVLLIGLANLTDLKILTYTISNLCVIECTLMISGKERKIIIFAANLKKLMCLWLWVYMVWVRLDEIILYT